MIPVIDLPERVKVRVLTSMAGPERSWQVGDIYDAEPKELPLLLERGTAEFVESQMTRAPRNAMRPRAKPKTTPKEVR